MIGVGAVLRRRAQWLIAGGMLLQGAAVALIAPTSGFGAWALGAVLLGAGTAMVYPTLLAAIGDVAHPTWRASSVGTYRFWRDAGFAIGAILAGLVADALGLTAAVWAVVAIRMYETLPKPSRAVEEGPPEGIGLTCRSTTRITAGATSW